VSLGLVSFVCMAQLLPSAYVLDPNDPRAPTHEQWEAMSVEERARIVDALPTSLPIEVRPPEGDIHRKTREGALGTLDDFFRRAGRRIYLSSELAVFYPGERSFVPDLMAVLDVELHDRMRWVVDAERQGLDLVIEVLVAGHSRKDLEENVERFARLGIQEYFVFDRGKGRIHGYRLLPGASVYQRIVPQSARYASTVLGLDLTLENDRLRFFAGNAPLEDANEVIGRLGALLDGVISREEQALARADAERVRADQETARADQETARAEQEASRADAAEARAHETKRLLDEALAEIERLKR
jgi:Uma2 family endonuclease